MRIFIIMTALVIAFSTQNSILPVHAQGVGQEQARRVAVPSAGVRAIVESSVNFVIKFVSLIAVVAIIAAGLVFMFGAGSDNSVQRAKKIIIYTLVGLLVIYFAKTIVGFVINVLSGDAVR